MSFSTSAQILTDLEGITYSATSHTVSRQFQILPEEGFEDFTNFPVFVITDGDEEGEPQANKQSQVMYHPEIHFFAEAESNADMVAWRDDARDAIMSNSTLWSHADNVIIDAINAFQSPDRSLQKLVFFLTIEFMVDHGN
jgi:hypothetical protein